MSVLNLNSNIYKTLKDDAHLHQMKIGSLAAYYLLLGKHLFDNQKSSFSEINTQVKEIILKSGKVTD